MAGLRRLSHRRYRCLDSLRARNPRPGDALTFRSRPLQPPQPARARDSWSAPAAQTPHGGSPSSALVLQLSELARRIQARHRQMIPRGPQYCPIVRMSHPTRARSRNTSSSSCVSSPIPTITPDFVRPSGVQLFGVAQQLQTTARSARPTAPRDTAAAPSRCCGSAPRAAPPPQYESLPRRPENPESALPRGIPAPARRISSITSAKTRAPPTRSSSRFTLVITACCRPSVATASATRRGSSKSIGSGRPFGTAQNPHRRVHRLPSIMNVAVL